jgi:hypothetical protein
VIKSIFKEFWMDVLDVPGELAVFFGEGCWMVLELGIKEIWMIK